MNDQPNSESSVPTRRRRRRGLPRILIVLYAIIILFFVVSALFIGYQFFYRDRIILGVSVQGQSMSGMTRIEAQQFLLMRFGNPDAILARLGTEATIIRDGNRTWRAYPWELGLRTDFLPVADQAMLLGHRDNWLASIADQAHCMWFGCDLGIDAQFDAGTAQAFLGWLAPQVDQPARDASIRLNGLQVDVTPAQNGRTLDGEAMIERLRQHIVNNERNDVTLIFRETPPLVADVNAAKSSIESILAAPVMLTFGGRTWAIDQAALAAMITIKPQRDANGKVQFVAALDHPSLVAQTKSIAGDINQAARDARFRFDPATGTLTPIITSQYGQTLDPEAAAKQIEQQMVASIPRLPGMASPLETINARVVSLPVTVTKPTIAMEDAAKFGIKQLVAQGVSNFRGSIPGRVQNIQAATAQFDGVVIPPGGTFSFNQFLGQVVEANGYDDAYVIFGDRTVLGPGGGVCQVSSTVFRAAFFGGFPIVERWAHAYRVGYYEPPVGLDATVFEPTVDFKFKNDTDAYLLIQTKIDLRNTTLTFNFYGTKPNRTVEMEDPIMDNIIPHGPAIYTDDPTLKKGVTKQVDSAHDGADVTIWRKILVNGQVVKREKFFSRYEPWVARYMVGTKVVK
ncbi:MAG: VanW family protein [Chloroflexi bacterium]|nr:VanW family protein [Chloroflexota bacterium]